LGVEIFTRSGKHLTRITPVGKEVLNIAGNILRQVDSIKQLTNEYNSPETGSLDIATTHTQARYVLPKVINNFIEKYPEVGLHMHQGTPLQISEKAADGTVDFAVATEALELFNDLIMMPCYRWNRCILVPKNHPLAALQHVTLEDVAKYSLVTYVFGFTGRSKLDDAFAEHNLTPKVVFTATDADVIKTYVRLGLGIGIVAHMAYDPEVDTDLVAIEAAHLFDASITSIGFRKGTYLRGYMYDFISAFAPHLTRDVVDKIMAMANKEEQEEFFSNIELPTL
jgi:LysR family cys regulon transcriptional activator